VFLLLSMTWVQVVADEPGVERFFARSGDQVVLEGVETLRFHRFELKPSEGQTFTLPSVRAPLVLKGYDRSGREVTELVVYPQEYKVWGREGVRPIRVRCQDAPAWFEQWADATGRVETTGARGTQPLVLVLGKDAAGGGPRCVLAVMERHRADVGAGAGSGLVRSGRNRNRTRCELDALSGPFSEELELLGDRSPLRFSTRHQPALALVNRRPCLGVKGELPLVEELVMDGSRRVLVSYLPWQQRLGRSEQADILFSAIIERLVHVASEPQEPLPDAGLNLVWPRPADVVESERPILYALLEREQPVARTLHVADLRGEPIPVAKRSELIRALEHRPLLVLGTDPMLTAKGSGVLLGQGCALGVAWWPNGANGVGSRFRATTNHMGSGCPKTTPDPFPDVFWIEDDRLPPDEGGRYRLMVELTRLGVRL
jgi:hypothetical protein